jgi:hypothetical protein
MYKLKLQANHNIFLVNWSDKLYIDDIKTDTAYIDLRLKDIDNTYEHRLFIGDLDMLWFLDSRVYPLLNYPDSVCYNYYATNSEIDLKEIKRENSKTFSYLMIKYSRGKAGLSYIQSQSVVNDSVDVVVRTTFANQKPSNTDKYLEEHKEIINSIKFE